MATPRQAHHSGYRSLLVSVVALVLAFRLPAQQPSVTTRHDAAAAAFAHGLMALHSAGVDRFAADHPAWDGRGVLIAILDSGIDPGVPGLATTSDGTPKILDLRDFSHEGRIALRPITVRGDTLFIGDRRLLGGAQVAARVVRDAPLWGGTLIETVLGKAPAADINGNGRVGDTLLVVVGRTPAGWALFADTKGTGTLVGEHPVHDFALAHEFFGWHQQDRSSAQAVAPPVDVAANFADSAGAPLLDLFFDTSSHGTHVAGIAAGHDIYGVTGFDGVAPGAKLIGLKIADDAHGDVSVTGSMVRALDYAIRFAHDRAMALVVNLSFGVGNEVEGTARIDALIDSILAVHPDVVMTVAAGNDGPGLSTIGFPASAARVISVGATLPLVFSGGTVSDTTADPIASFSSRGGEVAGPDIVVPGAAYSTVPNYAAGQEQETGTSMAAPYAAGLAARLLSALPASNHRLAARMVRQALRLGSKSLRSGGIADQGAGLPDIGAAWAWLAISHDLPEIAVDVGGVSGRGAVYASAPAGAASPGLGARIVLRRLDNAEPLTLRLRSDSNWVQLPETVALTNGRGEFTARLQPSPLAASGAISAAIRVEGPDETAGPVAVIPVILRSAVPDAGTKSPIVVAQPAGTTRRVFVHADTGRGLQIEVETFRAADHVTAALHEPGGMPFRDGASITAGFGDGAGLFDIGGNDVAGGWYEVDVMAGPLASISARLMVHPAPLRLGALLLRDTLHVTARSLVAVPLSVRLRAGLIGAERRINIQRMGDDPVQIAVPVPAWAAHLTVDTRMPREAWSRFTDLGLSFLDRRGRELESTPINYAFSRVTPDLPDSVVGDTIVLVLSPGFADPADHGPWSLDVSVRFYVATPYSLDAGGSPYKPVAAGALRAEGFAAATLPIALPPEFLPIVTVVALEGTEHIWTRELTIARPAKTP
jgi:subtilisin family serine protease